MAKTGSFRERTASGEDGGVLGRRRKGLSALGYSRERIDHEEPEMDFTRITVDPRQMGGVPCLRRLRIPVATVVDMVAEGMDVAEIREAYPDLETEDIREALGFTRRSISPDPAP
jgi:uncharacterized protein (DUF433 family)